MSLEPRFRRVAALNRRFVDREDALAALAEELGRIGDGPRVINVTGIGGIGKTRLLREVRDRSVAAGHRTALLDLQVPAHRQHSEALAVLRRQFGEQGVRFDRYDIAHAVLWQRLHPHLRVSRDDLPFAEQSEALLSVLDAASGVPVFGTAVSLVRLLEKARRGQRRRRRMKVDETLRQLDGLPTAELIDAVTYLFAEDLRAASTDRPYTVFLDAYEAMRDGEDDWTQDLVAQLDRGLTVVAGREPLSWDRRWSGLLRTVPIDGLPMAARLEVLADGGMADRAQRLDIAHASKGVPFYLHLAVDTAATGRTGGEASVVSGEEILRRFLRHVGADEVRFLELLSAARFFDKEIFRRVAEAFDLPGHVMAWDSLTSYSFIYPAGPHYLQLHQLMSGALRDRVAPDTAHEVHRVLRRVWDDRAAPREAAYHALAAGELTAAELLDYADRIKTAGGARGIAGLLADLRENDQGELADARRCLAAEEALLYGDAGAAIELTPDGSWALGTPAGGRLAVAGAHARRIGGATAAALAIYTAMWEGHDGRSRLEAGLWAADLHMAQGGFDRARRLAQSVLAGCPDHDHELRGDVFRLLHLIERFSLDFDAARGHLDQAARWYDSAGSVFGRSAAQTNRAELLAWTDPAAAVDAAGEAIERQRELGALHELGKAYTALAMAQLQLDRHPAAAAALDLACEALDRAGYRSGRARAELIRGFMLARRGLPERAASAARRAVTELVAVEVYPTLILLAERLIEVLGDRDAPASEAARAARGRLEGAVAERVPALVTRLLGIDPHALLRAARERGEPASGFYNENIRVGSSLVRIPIAGADGMDLRIWPEHAVLAAVGPHLGDAAPRIRFAGAGYQIHDFVTGTLLDELAPRGTRVPEFVLDDVVALFRNLTEVPARDLPPPPEWWPDDGDTASFARRLSGVTGEVYTRFTAGAVGTPDGDFGELFGRLGIPRAPLRPIASGWDALSARPFCLVHADVHRKNMILAPAGHTVVLDWELALYGDPVYELAVHLHKMAYLPDERAAVVDRWHRAMPARFIAGWRRDLPAYLAHERVKSAVVDTVRYTGLIAGGLPAERERFLLEKLTGKLNAAGEIWGWDRTLAYEDVGEIVRRDARARAPR